jgi:hypothetical protein
MELVEREKEILKILEKLGKMDFILVGGYAVSSLAMHRFSVDCDLVVSNDLGKVKSILAKEGYTLQYKKDGFDTVYGGRFENYTKKTNNVSVCVDLLIKSIVSRGTNASWSFEYIKKHSIVSKIGMPPIACTVPERELLIAMKLHSGRKTDIRDIIMLLEGCDLEKMAKHIKRGDMKMLLGKIDSIIESLDDENLVDSLKGVFRLERDVKLDIKRSKNALLKIKKLLPQR